MTSVIQARPVERREMIAQAEFHRDYLSATGRPLVVTGVLPTWPAFRKWNLDFFRERYGDDMVKVADDIESPRFRVTAPLREFLNYAEAPQWSTLGRLARARGIRDRSLYMYEFKPFRLHPELMDDLGELPFCDNWFRHLRSPLREWCREWLGWILMGPAGTFSKLHQDFLHMHVWLGQITGRKRCVFFSPEDSRFLYGGAVDPWQPDLERFPLFVHATPYETMLEPGDLVLFPANWWHQVRSLEFSITPSFHLVNETNIHEHILDLMAKPPEFLLNPEIRSALSRAASGPASATMPG